MLVLCRQAQAEPQVTEEERKRYEQEFEDYHKKLQDAKDEYVALIMVRACLVLRLLFV